MFCLRKEKVVSDSIFRWYLGFNLNFVIVVSNFFYMVYDLYYILKLCLLCLDERIEIIFKICNVVFFFEINNDNFSFKFIIRLGM